MIGVTVGNVLMVFVSLDHDAVCSQAVCSHIEQLFTGAAVVEPEFLVWSATDQDVVVLLPPAEHDIVFLTLVVGLRLSVHVQPAHVELLRDGQGVAVVHVVQLVDGFLCLNGLHEIAVGLVLDVDCVVHGPKKQQLLGSCYVQTQYCVRLRNLHRVTFGSSRIQTPQIVFYSYLKNQLFGVILYDLQHLILQMFLGVKGPRVGVLSAYISSFTCIQNWVELFRKMECVESTQAMNFLYFIEKFEWKRFYVLLISNLMYLFVFAGVRQFVDISRWKKPHNFREISWIHYSDFFVFITVND